MSKPPLPTPPPNQPFFGKCIRCVDFHPLRNGEGYCSNIRAFKEITGKTFTNGAPEGPTFTVKKLDGCSQWRKLW
jgi:hypothetical protein